jgi:GT2 family glycosyltransferase
MVQLSIIIVNYNTFKLTCSCIKSIYTFTKNIQFEIILVDNSSTECDPNRFLVFFPKLILIPLPQNVGFAKGNNAGIDQAIGNTILLLNSDTEIVDDILSASYHKLTSDDAIGVLSIQLRYPDGKIQHNCQRFPSEKLELIEIFRIQKFWNKQETAKALLGSFFSHEQEAEVDWIWGTYFMFQKQTLKLLPDSKLSDNYFMYGEDVQWCYEIKKYTHKKILFWPRSYIIHHLAASSSDKKDSYRKKMMNKNEAAFIRKYYGLIRFYTIRTLRYIKNTSIIFHKFQAK